MRRFEFAQILQLYDRTITRCAGVRLRRNPRICKGVHPTAGANSRTTRHQLNSLPGAPD
jgi:hypothetical protein